ncbi:hypothetical protein [Nonomuraea indica]|uniref:Uncharacterized protein n=1 Tax=Nonomuraea indica TaxID=1581193 RepID=A0ABW8A7S3_9ACTN
MRTSPEQLDQDRAAVLGAALGRSFNTAIAPLGEWGEQHRERIQSRF